MTGVPGRGGNNNVMGLIRIWGEHVGNRRVEHIRKDLRPEVPLFRRINVRDGGGPHQRDIGRLRWGLRH